RRGRRQGVSLSFLAGSHPRRLPGANPVRDGGRAPRNKIRPSAKDTNSMMTRIPICGSNRLENLLRRVEETEVIRNHGRVVQLIGLVIESEGPLAAVGEICRIESAGLDGATLA